MEKIYSEPLRNDRSIKSRPDTIRFLMDFSKSFHTMVHKDLVFESHLN